MKIALDAMGGDHAPDVTVGGAAKAISDLSGLEKLYLVGDEATIKAELDKQRVSSLKIEIVHAPTVVTMEDAPTAALRGKKDSSITRATELVKRGEAAALVSAGSTGAAVAASTVLLRNLSGVDRAGIASPIPNEYGTCNIVDAGANPEAKPEHLLHYGVMGAVYARRVFGVENPVVGLMSTGEEDHKGTDFTREVFALLKASNLNFRGNVEGHDLFESRLDVVVCDGFVGNVILKSCEATAKAMFKWVKQEVMASGPLVQIGAKLSKPAFLKVKERGNYETYGGSPLLGVNGICIIGHGSSSSLAVFNAIRVACEAVRHELNPHIEEEIRKLPR
jgi:phosphate acyltransferase